MAVGAKDNLERELVKKYSKMKVDNPATTKLVDPKDMIATMNDIAKMQYAAMIMYPKLKSMCTNVISKSVQYTKINFNPPRRKRT